MTKLTDPVLEMGLLGLCEVNIKCGELNPSISKDVWIIIILLVLFYEDLKKTEYSNTFWKKCTRWFTYWCPSKQFIKMFDLK